MTPDLLYALNHCGYDAFRRWCQLHVWPGCGHGSELQHELHDDRADKLLLAAEDASWIRRGSFQRTPTQHLFAHPGGHFATPKPCEWHWEPVRDGEFYGEFVAFCQLSQSVFWEVMRTTRLAVEAADRAGRSVYWHGAQAAASRLDAEEANKAKATARRRAHLVRKLGIAWKDSVTRDARYLVTQFLDADRAHAVAETKRLWNWDEECRP